jgi:hypothetical protein
VDGGIVDWIARKSRHRICIGWIFQHRFHVGSALPRFHLSHALVVNPRYLVQLEGELIVLQPRQPVSQRIDRIVRPGQGTVASGIGDGELKIRI